MSRPILMPLAIGLTLLAIQQLSGIDSIIFFTVEIFRSSGNLAQYITEHDVAITIKFFTLTQEALSTEIWPQYLWELCN